MTFNVNAGTPGKTTEIYHGSEFTIDCIDCYVTGSFEVTGHLSVKHFRLQDLVLVAVPNNFLAKLELQSVVTASEAPASLNYTKQLFAAPIPDVGIVIPHFLELGATIEYDVGVGASLAGSATINYGLSASLPNTAKLTADMEHPEDSSAVGFDSAVTPIFDVEALSASITLTAFSQPKLVLGIDLDEIGHLDVAFPVKIPELSATLTATLSKSQLSVPSRESLTLILADETGPACPDSSSTSKTGVKLDSTAKVEVDLELDANLGDDNINSKPTWSHALWVGRVFHDEWICADNAAEQRGPTLLQVLPIEHPRP